MSGRSWAGHLLLRQLDNGSTDQAQTLPVSSQDHFAGIVAEFRDSYPGGAEIFDLA
jgi:hypothetical protein